MPVLKKADYQIEHATHPTDHPAARDRNKVIKDIPGLANTVVKIPHHPFVSTAIPYEAPAPEPVQPTPAPQYSVNEAPAPVAIPQPESPQPISQPMVSDAHIKELEAKARAALSQQQSEFEREVAQRRSSLEQELTEYRNKLVAEAESKKKAILDQAYKEGLERGKAEAKTEYTQKSLELTQSIAALSEEKAKIVRQAKPEVLKLALAIAHQLVKSEISLNQAVTLNIVSEAIEKVTDNTKVIIRVNRADVEFLKMNHDRIAQQLGDVKSLVIQEDGRIETGGCIIETNLGYIDATIQTKFDAIKQVIMATLEDEETVANPGKRKGEKRDKSELDMDPVEDDWDNTPHDDLEEDHDSEPEDDDDDTLEDEAEDEEDDEFSWDEAEDHV